MRRKSGKLWSGFFATKLFLFGLILIVCFVFFVYAKGFYQDFKIKREIESLEKEIAGLESKKLESMEILSYVMSNSFVEEKARTELNMQEEGEKIVFFNNHEDFENENKNEYDTENRKVLHNPLKWWYYFTNKSIE
ncbi:MAG: septum formation initiator family protein [Candidatus Magasanikbacteria bacterium]|nr:septum formation initiator family protein [Candidatus Magasanikbacteria bacterium]